MPNARYVADDGLEPLFAEQLVLAVIERLAEFSVALAADHLPEGWKGHGVLARGMRPIHTQHYGGGEGGGRFFPVRGFPASVE
jgi:hypothetical protein